VKIRTNVRLHVILDEQPFWLRPPTASTIRLVPTDFPYGDDLLKRVPVPFLYQKIDHAVALHPAGGESELAARAVVAGADTSTA
jgi:hypothetical protein